LCEPDWGLALLAILVPFATKCAGQDPGDPPETRAVARQPIFTDMTIWGGHTAGSINEMSAYPGQEAFAVGIELRRQIYTFRHTRMQWNIQVVPPCAPSVPNASGRTYHSGGGASVGLSLEPRRRRKIQPNFDASVGLLGFTDPTPMDTRRKNYSLQFGPGSRFRCKGGVR
jgi:hypothetical protein